MKWPGPWQVKSSLHWPGPSSGNSLLLAKPHPSQYSQFEKPRPDQAHSITSIGLTPRFCWPSLASPALPKAERDQLKSASKPYHSAHHACQIKTAMFQTEIFPLAACAGWNNVHVRKLQDVTNARRVLNMSELPESVCAEWLEQSAFSC